MNIPNLADLEAQFYGAYGGGVTTDAKYAALRALVAAGKTWEDVLAEVPEPDPET